MKQLLAAFPSPGHRAQAVYLQTQITKQTKIKTQRLFFKETELKQPIGIHRYTQNENCYHVGF